MKLTPQQVQILQAARANGGTITKKQVVEGHGGEYYCNAEKHLGGILSRMVNAGLLERVRPGVFVIGTGKKSKPAKEAEYLEYQTRLFE